MKPSASSITSLALTRSRVSVSTCITLLCVHSLIAGQTPSGPADHQTVGPLTPLMQPLVDSHAMAGAVALVATKDKILDAEAVGYADLAAKTPMRVNDEFWIASMNKAMTAAALMMLVDDGKVKVDDPVEKYLPEFKGQMVLANRPTDLNNPGNATGPIVPATHPFTIREMLCHTAGLRFRSVAEPHALDRLSLKDAVRTYAAQPLIYQPGTEYSYSNEDMNTAGRIIEVVSGMPYDQFLQQRLFDPLGMKDTTFWPNAEQISRLAKSYKSNDKADALIESPITQVSLPLSDREHRYPFPAGGLFSTAIDCAKFMQMLLNDGNFQGRQILSAASVKEMTTEQNKGMGKTSYGFGLTVHPGIFDHNGAYGTSMFASRTNGSILIFMIQKADSFHDQNLHTRLQDASKRIVESSRAQSVSDRKQ